MNTIHPTAIVSPEAKLGDNLNVGPYAVIEGDVETGSDCELGPHAVLYNGARLGNKIKIKQSASVANVPQDLKFGDEKTIFMIGDNTVVREFAALHRGTIETGKSSVGKNCLIMAYAHIPHDCTVGDNCIIANAVQIGGHAHIGDWVVIGGLTAVHQFVIIGDHAMIGGGTRISQDVPPYVLVAGEPLRYSGLNVVGLKRRGFEQDDIKILKEVYGYIYESSLNLSQARKKIESTFVDNVHVKNVLSFLDKSTRGIAGK